MTNTINTYLEQQILSADPIETVRMLYQAAIIRTQDARRCLAQGDIAERTRHINQVFEILNELNSSLDFEKGGAISFELARLYDYMQRRLFEANSAQQDAPLAEVTALLSTVGEAWAALAQPKQIHPENLRQWPTHAPAAIEMQTYAPQAR